MSLSQQSESPPPQDMLATSKLAQRFWQALHRWFRVNTFAPAWLGKRWGHPLIGIGAAILSQVIVVSLRQLLVQAFPQAVFYSALSLLSVAIIALSWGAGPSVISTLLGALLLDMFILPHMFSIAFDSGSAVLSILIYLLAGFAISALASQTERARRSAQTLAATLEQERARLETTLESLLLMAEALVEVPSASPSSVPGKLPTTNEAAQRLVELTHRVLGCKRVSIVAIEPDTELQLPVATVGLNPAEEAYWWNEQAKIPLSAGPDPTLAPRLRAGEMVIVDVTKPPYEGQPNPYHIQTVLVAPIRIGERLIGVLGLDYGNAAHAFTAQEIALTNAASQLGALVLERARLTRERAEAQGKVVALEEATDRINQFLSLISHELRTPVTTLKIGIQLMLKRLEGMAADEQDGPDRLLSLFQQQEQGLRRTNQQIRRLTHLLDDLIDLSRIRMGKLDIHAERCDLGALVRETVEMERLSYPNRSVSLMAPPDASVQVQADPDRIGQVLTNYLTNVLKYSPADQPVEVGLEAQGQRARVWVRDQGPGIPPEEQEHVWELFHRVPGIEVKNGSEIGLGLGLYLSKMMIEQHHGEVGVESRPGQGSTFWFTLPLAAPDEPAHTNP